MYLFGPNFCEIWHVFENQKIQREELNVLLETRWNRKLWPNQLFQQSKNHSGKLSEEKRQMEGKVQKSQIPPSSKPTQLFKIAE